MTIQGATNVELGVGTSGRRSALLTVAGMVLAAHGLLLALAGLQLLWWSTDTPPPCQTVSCGPETSVGTVIEGMWVVALPMALIYVLAAAGVLARRSWGRALGIVLGLLAVVIFAFAASIAWIDVLLTFMVLGLPLALNVFVLIVLATRWRPRSAGSP